MYGAPLSINKVNVIYEERNHVNDILFVHESEHIVLVYKDFPSHNSLVNMFLSIICLVGILCYVHYG